MPPGVAAGDFDASEAAITLYRYSMSIDWVDERVFRSPGDYVDNWNFKML